LPGVRDRRRPKFFLVSGEELGMFGSTHYVLQAGEEERKIAAAVNGDMIGYPLTGNPVRLIVGSYPSRNHLIDSALVYNKRYGIGATLDAVVDTTGASDYGPFAAAGRERAENLCCAGTGGNDAAGAPVGGRRPLCGLECIGSAHWRLFLPYDLGRMVGGDSASTAAVTAGYTLLL